MTSPTTSTSHAGQPCWFLTTQGLTLALLLTFLLSFSATPFLTPTSVKARSQALRRHLQRLLLLEEDSFLRDSLINGVLKNVTHRSPNSAAHRRLSQKQKQKPRIVIVKKFSICYVDTKTTLCCLIFFFFFENCCLIFSVNKQTKLFFSYFNYYQLRMVFIV